MTSTPAHDSRGQYRSACCAASCPSSRKPANIAGGITVLRDTSGLQEGSNLDARARKLCHDAEKVSARSCGTGSCRMLAVLRALGRMLGRCSGASGWQFASARCPLRQTIDPAMPFSDRHARPRGCAAYVPGYVAASTVLCMPAAGGARRSRLLQDSRSTSAIRVDARRADIWCHLVMVSSDTCCPEQLHHRSSTGSAGASRTSPPCARRLRVFAAEGCVLLGLSAACGLCLADLAPRGIAESRGACACILGLRLAPLVPHDDISL